MLSEKDLQELLSFQGQHPVLSVYLNTEPSEGSADAYKLRLRSMLKDIGLREDARAVERYFDHTYDWSGRSVALFSCAEENFFRAYPLAVPVRSRVRINSQPHVKPLADVLDNFGGYGVALIDKQGARLFYFHLGTLVEQEGTMGETVKHTKRGGASSLPGQRGGVAGRTNKAEEVVERNMREAVEFATHFFNEYSVRRVLIGGTDDNISLFRSMLPKAWQSLIVGTFPMSMTASKDEVMSKAIQVGQEAERRREAQLVQAVITGAAKGKHGVIELDNVLSAVRDGRVQTLLVKEGFRAPGYRCTGCGYLTSTQVKVCPFCNSTFEQIPDAVEMAVHDVMRQGGDVEILHDEQMMDDCGKIAAMLRY